MPATQPTFPKTLPLSPQRNPQPDFFTQPPPSQPWSTLGRFGAELWHVQKQRLAMYAPDKHRRKQARDNPAPAAQRLAVSESFAYQSPTAFTRTGPRAEPRQETLAAMLQDIAQDIAFALSRPLSVYADRESTRIELLGCVAWVRVHRQRRLQVELRDADGAWQPSTRDFDLGHPLCNSFWIEQVLLRWVREIDETFVENAFEAFDWLEGKLAEHFHSREREDSAQLGARGASSGRSRRGPVDRDQERPEARHCCIERPEPGWGLTGALHRPGLCPMLNAPRSTFNGHSGLPRAGPETVSLVVRAVRP